MVDNFENKGSVGDLIHHKRVDGFTPVRLNYLGLTAYL